MNDSIHTPAAQIKTVKKPNGKHNKISFFFFAQRG